MRLKIRKLRQIIREEIGRNMKTVDDRTSNYPWDIGDTPVDIYPVASEDEWWAEVEMPDGEVVKQTKPNEEEATFWARDKWDKAQRQKFGGSGKKDS